jgi:pilus assembly protein Flp/PilA
MSSRISARSGADLQEPTTAFINWRGSIMKLVQFIKNFGREDDGVTAIEYGLIAALIAVTIIISVTAVGDQLVLVFTAISTALAAAL